MPTDSLSSSDLMKFFETTGLRGVPRIVKSSHPLTRALWFISVIVCFVMMIYQTVTLLVNYNSNDVTTHFNEIQTKPGFPDVTICNINPYDAFQRFPMSYDEYVSRIMKIKKGDDSKPLDSTTAVDIVWTELSSKRGYIVNNPRFKGSELQPTRYLCDRSFLVRLAIG